MNAKAWLTRFSLVYFLTPISIVYAVDEVTLQLRWYDQFQFAGYYMAQEKGFYEEQGIKVNIKPGGKDALNVVRALLNNDAQFAVSNSAVVINYMEGDPILALAAIGQTSPIVWITLASKNIRIAQDLPGHTLMALPRPANAELSALLNQEGIPPESINVIPTSFDINDLISGKVDAYNGYISNEPFYLKQKNIDFHLIKPRDYGINFYSDVLITRQSLAKSNPDLVKRFKQASLQGWQYAMDNIEESIDIIAKKYAPNKSKEHLKYEAEKISESILPELVQIGHMNPGRWQHIANVYKDLDMTKESKDISGFIFNEAVPKSYTFSIFVASISLVLLVIFSFAIYHFRRLSLALKASNQELACIAISHPLTGIMNRRGFMENAERLLSLEQREKKTTCLMILDIDYFKKINDQYGHQIGDFCLIEFTEIVQSCCRLHDLVARIGGEEFVILLGDCDTEQAREKASYIIKRIREHQFKPNGINETIHLTVSIGLAEVKNGLMQAWQQADEALYTVKNSGRDGLQIFMSSL
jgi:diguanylate cyclase (GGDEF)-like protein